MPRVCHVVVTDAFAGVERYVCNVAAATVNRGWEVIVLGGDPERMGNESGDRVRWEPAATLFEAAVALRRMGRADVCHAHMTSAEVVALALRPWHGAPVVSTRHFAARRGASVAGRLVAPWVARGVAREIAISTFVAGRLERWPDAVLRSAVGSSAHLWQASSRVVLVLQRLEHEKDTMTAVRAWKESGLVDHGWHLRIVGDGSERRALEEWVRAKSVVGVTFAGRVDDVAAEFRGAGILLATAPAEPLGLAVVEAMAAGLPVVASAGGGHLETAGLISEAPQFPPGNAALAAIALRAMRSDGLRATLSALNRRVAGEQFVLERHVERLIAEYEIALSSAKPRVARWRRGSRQRR